jgi:twitching motility protein PilT
VEDILSEVQAVAAPSFSAPTNGNGNGTAPPAQKVSINTAALVSAMVSVKGASDLVFSPGRPPQVELHGRLTGVNINGLPMLLPEHTAQIAKDLVGSDENAQAILKRTGSCDLSYSLPQKARFRVNVFRQRSTHAIVMRVIPHNIPSFEDLRLPPELRNIANLKNGIVLVTGPTGSGKSSTLAAIIDLINSTRADHIVTIEDPIEFLHVHKLGTVHQRELHCDTDSFANALRAALRQAPKVILVGEMRDQETIEIAMTAAETGHLVFSTLHTIDASKTVERIIGVFPAADQQTVRTRLAASFRYFVSQRLMPRKDGKGRVAMIEILKSTMRTRDYIEKGEGEGKTLLDAMRDGDMEGMQDFDSMLDRAVNFGVITKADALHYSTNPGNLALRLSETDDAEIPAASPEVLYAAVGEEAVEVER